ncbi:MAG: hypothetical protein ACRD3T_02240 [Terriglobia bacterium]
MGLRPSTVHENGVGGTACGALGQGKPYPYGGTSNNWRIFNAASGHFHSRKLLIIKE